MWNRRKFIALSLTAVAGASLLLSACASPGQTGASGQSKQLQYQIWNDTVVPVLNQQIGDFTATHPGAQVKINVVPYDDYWTKLPTTIAAGAGPDIYWMTRPNYDIWSRRGTAANLDGMLQSHPELQKNLDAMEPLAVESYKYQGKFYGIPWGIDDTAIVYNEDALKAAGLKPLADIEDSFTWDVLREYASKLTKREGGRTVQYGFMVPPSRYWWDFIWSNGGELFNADGSKSLLASPQNVEALQFLADLQLKDKVSPDVNAAQAESADDMFMSGKIAIMPTGSWQLATFSKIKGFKWNAVQFPKSPRTGKRGSTANVTGYIVNPNAKDKNAVADFLTSLTSQQSQSRLAESGTNVPTRKDAQAAMFAPNLGPANRIAFQKALEYAHPMKFSAWVSYQEVIKYGNDAVTAILSGAKPVDVALQEGAAAMDKSIQEAQSKQ